MPELVHWNPRLRLRRTGVLSRVRRLKRENNFGDLLGPRIVIRVCETMNLGAPAPGAYRLLSVGSIINTAGRDGDIVWGSGVHGNFLPPRSPIPQLDVRAVRGPLTAAVLRQSGNYVPDVYGDPALLIPYLWSDAELQITRRSGGTVLVPNYYDLAAAPANALNPRGDLLERIRTIASAERVFASSLHGIIIAEAYGIPAVLVASGSEQLFKYEDYYRGTRRGLPPVAPDWRSAFETPPADPIQHWEADPLLRAFPTELWLRHR